MSRVSPERSKIFSNFSQVKFWNFPNSGSGRIKLGLFDLNFIYFDRFIRQSQTHFSLKSIRRKIIVEFHNLQEVRRSINRRFLETNWCLMQYWLQGAPLLRGKSVLSCKFDVKLGVHFIKVKLIKKAKSPHLHLVILSTQGNDCRLMVMVTVMVTLFIHGKSLSKYYKMVQEQLIIPN